MDAVSVALVGFFTFAALLLFASSYDRFAFVFFIVRSSYGIRLIDRISGFRPRLWEFLADFSVILSFGGLGAFYLSHHERTRQNLYRSFPILSFVAAAFAFALGLPYHFYAFFAAGVLGSRILSDARDAGLNILFTMALFAGAGSMAFPVPVAMFMGVLGLPSLLIYVMSSHGLQILFGQTDMPGVSPMVPSTRDGAIGVAFPGYDIFIPWWHALTALVITLAVHEGAHGVLTRVAKVKLKSTGILTLFSVPIGAFVEPDEEELNSKSSVDRMRVFTAGSFANLLTGSAAVVALLVLTGVFANVVVSDGMRVINLIEGYPADGVLPRDTVVYEINGVATMDFAGFKDATSRLAPGMQARLETSRGVYTFTAAESPQDPDKGYLGVYVVENLVVNGSAGYIMSVPLLSFLINSLSWIAFFNINIALVNLLPVIPFDGGRMFREFVEAMRLSDANIKRVLYGVLAFTVILLFVNIIPIFTMAMEHVLRWIL